jgi:hypothetical protein
MAWQHSSSERKRLIVTIEHPLMVYLVSIFFVYLYHYDANELFI